ncbi:MAG TPA: exosortase/archaeosortase family protein [Candidatus Aquilonibacter sp.]|nr:exosortase/archaeosortase family protein [Candidatus Aquilonibacter sp.]
MNENQPNKTRPSLWQDTIDCWQLLSNKTFFFSLLAAWLALFQFSGNPILGYVKTPSLFSWMLDMYNNPTADDAHGKFIPFLVVGLFWWKRRVLLALPLKIWWPGFLILIFALALHVFGFLIQQPYFSIVALFAGVFGLMGLAWGRDWLRHSVFPFWLFIFSIPLGERGQIITFPLQQIVSWLTEKCAHVLGIDVIRNGTQLLDPSGTYAYEVAAACSGIRSLVAVFLLAAIYGFVVFQSPWKRIFLLALSPPFAVLGNLLRMLLIIVAATMGGRAAGDYVHNNWLISLIPYVPAIAGFLLVGRWLENREAKKLRA